MACFRWIRIIFAMPIFRDCLILVALGATLCIFPFKSVWADWQVFQYTGCTNLTGPLNTKAECNGSATCKYVNTDGSLVKAANITLNVWAESFCSTSPVQNQARIYTYVQDPFFNGLYGEAYSIVTATHLPMFFIFNHMSCDPNAPYVEIKMPLAGACPPAPGELADGSGSNCIAAPQNGCADGFVDNGNGQCCAPAQTPCQAAGGSFNSSNNTCGPSSSSTPSSPVAGGTVGLTPGYCGASSDFGTFSSGCASGLTFSGGICDRSSAFKTRCLGSGYDPEFCWCPDGMGLSPIVVDVDHTGFQMTDAANGVVFNFLNDNVPLNISWIGIKSTNALLVLDRDNNGKIDNGEELFGNITPQPPSSSPNGFLALVEFDKSQNGGNENHKIDQGDAIYARLRLWQDTNHNGVSESSELHTLNELGISGISLDFKLSKKTDLYGNRFEYRSKVYDANGEHTGRFAWDVFLRVR